VASRAATVHNAAFQPSLIQPNNTITARHVQPDARRIRGLLKSPHAAPLTVEQMDQAVSKQLRDKHALSHAGRKSAGR
jgi:antitoxin PrlF